MALRRLPGAFWRPICRAQSQRRLSSHLKPWEKLSESEKAAWESLGHGESWHRTPQNQKSLASWGQLQAHQQAAAKHGLGLHEESWERLRAQLQAEAAPKTPSVSSGAPLAPDAPGAARAGAGLAGVAWSVCKTLAPIVGDALDSAKHPGLRLLGGAFRYMADVNDTLAAPVKVDDIETIMYLDDSGSMRGSVQGVFGKSGLQLGQDALDQVVPLLQGPTRILKFGTLPKVLLPREELSASQETAATATLLHSVVAAQWNGTSGGTYMWKMIEEDVRSRYLPGHGRLRLIVITDGEDTHSPGVYCGIKGMDALMKELQKQGFDVEWHIIIIGRFQAAERKRYETLAGATGGSFLALEEAEAFQSPAARRFLAALKENPGARQARQQAYLADTAAGRMERVEWFKALPPPEKGLQREVPMSSAPVLIPKTSNDRAFPFTFLLFASALGLQAKLRFSELRLAEAGKQAMREAFQYELLTEIQQKTFESIRSGAEVVARAKTGSGKTLSFLLPCLDRLHEEQAAPGEIAVLVLTPVRELSMQVAAEAEKLAKYYSSSMVCMTGGVRWEEDLEALNAATGAVTLVATPGRLQSHATKTDGFADRLGKVQILVLDEVDQLASDVFRQATLDIVKVLPPASQRQSLFYSATMGDAVTKLVSQIGKPDHIYVDVIRSDDVLVPEHIRQTYTVLPTERMTECLWASLTIAAAEEEAKVVVIFMTGRIAAYYAEAFRKSGTDLPVFEIHARRSQKQRTDESERFRAATRGVLFTSDVSSRGLDYPGVTHVIQMGAAHSKAEYVHRLGRTGRAGREGQGLLLLHEFEQGFLAEVSDLGIAEVPAPNAVGEMPDFIGMPIAKNVKAQAYYSRINHVMRNSSLGKLEIMREAKRFAASVGALDEEGRPPEITRENAEKMDRCAPMPCSSGKYDFGVQGRRSRCFSLDFEGMLGGDGWMSGLTLGLGGQASCFRPVPIDWEEVTRCCAPVIGRSGSAEPSCPYTPQGFEICCEASLIAEVPTGPREREAGASVAELALGMMAVSAGTPCGSACLWATLQQIRAHVASSYAGAAAWGNSRYYRVNAVGQILVLCWVAMNLLHTAVTGPNEELHLQVSDLLLLVATSWDCWEHAFALKVPLFRLVARLLHLGSPMKPGPQPGLHCNATGSSPKRLLRLWRLQWSLVQDATSVATSYLPMVQDFLKTPFTPTSACEWLAVAGQYVLTYRYSEHGFVGLEEKESFLQWAARAMTMALLKAGREKAAATFLQSAWPVLYLLADACWMGLLQPSRRNVAEFLQWIAPLLPQKHPVIFEAGSFDGKHSELMAHAWPEGKVFVWEANPLLCKKVEMKLTSLSNVVVMCGGLGTSTGTTSFWHCGEDATLYYEEAVARCAARALEVVEVPTATLQAASERLGVRPDFLWLDVESAELDLLGASVAPKGTTRGPPVLAKVAVMKLETRESGLSSLKDLEALLAWEGFSLVLAPAMILYPSTPVYPFAGSFDAIFIRRHVLEEHLGIRDSWAFELDAVNVPRAAAEDVAQNVADIEDPCIYIVPSPTKPDGSIQRETLGVLQIRPGARSWFPNTLVRSTVVQEVVPSAPVITSYWYSLTPYPASDHYFPYHDAGCAHVVVMSKAGWDLLICSSTSRRDFRGLFRYPGGASSVTWNKRPPPPVRRIAVRRGRDSSG
ncbi:unnamed protein product [Symbiodinium necroappetens]|uniref:ATP-dependent RNA helicase n=1 Tax=Symbiodinium necroappetens TaxID=1628268 RepID=A0A812PZP6_9DINO|nr:unnamed protein product [Symbiodinium necroappetens]